MALDSFLVVSREGIRENVPSVAQSASTPPFPFRVYPMRDDVGDIYYYAQADNIPECSVIGYSPEEVFILMTEAQEVWVDMMTETEPET